MPMPAAPKSTPATAGPTSVGEPSKSDVWNWIGIVAAVVAAPESETAAAIGGRG